MHQLDIIDFHCHHIPKRFPVTATRTAPPHQRARWEALARRLSDEELLLRDIGEGLVAARIVNIPAQLTADADGRVEQDSITAMNDHLAEMVARYPGRVHGLASVDAFDGDRSAREAERAIRVLGLKGLFVDCARGDLLMDAPQARPTLTVAAELGVPVFVHPVAPQPLTRLMTPYGVIGTLFARGAANSASLLALVEGGVFSELPALRVVVTALAFGGLSLSAALSEQSALPTGTLEVMRKHVFIDTMWPHPVLLRAAVDLLGVDHVVAGSDWPIVEEPGHEKLANALRGAQLTRAEQDAITAGNCRLLLGIA